MEYFLKFNCGMVSLHLRGKIGPRSFIEREQCHFLNLTCDMGTLPKGPHFQLSAHPMPVGIIHNLNLLLFTS